MCTFGFCYFFLLYFSLPLMINEFPYLCSTASVLPTEALMCKTHLLSLLLPFLLVINARNKCVTLVWIVIMENDDSGYFSIHRLPPCSYLHLWEEIRKQWPNASCPLFEAFIAS